MAHIRRIANALTSEETTSYKSSHEQKSTSDLTPKKNTKKKRKEHTFSRILPNSFACFTVKVALSHSPSSINALQAERHFAISSSDAEGLKITFKLRCILKST